MEINVNLRAFLKETRDLIATNNFNELFSYDYSDLSPEILNLPGFNLYVVYSDLRELLHESGINFLNYMDYIPYYCFENSYGRNLDDFVVPKNIKSIGDFAFGRSDLKSIDIPDSVTKLGRDCFIECMELEKVKLSNNLKEIPYGTFLWCESLEDITIPEGVTTVGSYAFSGSGLKRINLPNSLRSIGEYAFDNTDRLQEVTLPNNLETIGEYVFSGTTELRKIVLPNSLKEIPKYAFSKSGLQEITIPKSVKKISASAFKDCNNLTIYGYKDSYAEKYAEKYKINFKSI